MSLQVVLLILPLLPLLDSRSQEFGVSEVSDSLMHSPVAGSRTAKLSNQQVAFTDMRGPNVGLACKLQTSGSAVIAKGMITWILGARVNLSGKSKGTWVLCVTGTTTWPLILDNPTSTLITVDFI